MKRFLAFSILTEREWSEPNPPNRSRLTQESLPDVEFELGSPMSQGA